MLMCTEKTENMYICVKQKNRVVLEYSCIHFNEKTSIYSAKWYSFLSCTDEHLVAVKTV